MNIDSCQIYNTFLKYYKKITLINIKFLLIYLYICFSSDL